MVEHWLVVNGKPVRFIEAGAGRPIIFAAGLGISADFYKPNMRSLANAGFRAMTPDMPGFGKTRGSRRGMSVSEMATHLIDFADALGLENAFWVGHSIGCQALLHIAERRRDLVRAIVLTGPTGGYGDRLLHQVRGVAIAAVSEPWRLMKAVLRDYLRLSPFTYIGTWIKAAKDDPLEHAARTHCPALILVGDHDRVPRAKFIGQLAQKLRNAEVLKLTGGQHGLPLDAQDQFDSVIIDFFRNQPS